MVSLIEVKQAEEDLNVLYGAVSQTSTDAEFGDAYERLREFVTKNAPFQPEGFGEKIKRRDLHGKRLRVGDQVKVYNSQRYGNPTGVVVGAAEGEGSTGPRVEVRLDDGRDDHYTPSQGRVERLISAKADVEEVAA